MQGRRGDGSLLRVLGCGLLAYFALGLTTQAQQEKTDPEKAATLPVSLALDPQYADITGEYFANHKPALRSPRARNQKLAEELYFDTMAELDLPTL